MDSSLHDDRLRLLFTCCHPALPLEARVALTLQDARRAVHRRGGAGVPGLRGGDAPAAARARAQDRRQGHPLPRPARRAAARAPRGVLAVVYLVFNEGHTAAGGPQLVREELCAEAIRLGRLLAGLMPDEPEALGLLALMLLTDARRAARSTRRAGRSGSPTRTAAAGTRRRSRRAPRCWTGRCASAPRALPAPGRDRRAARHRARAGRRPTGRRSPRSTARWRPATRRPWWRSTAPSPSASRRRRGRPGAAAHPRRRPALAGYARCMPRGPSCCPGPATRPRPTRPMCGRSPRRATWCSGPSSRPAARRPRRPGGPAPGPTSRPDR